MKNKDTISVSTLDEYIREVSVIESTVFHSKTTNIFPIYRGQADSNWAIEPAVYRNNLFPKEATLIREMERTNPSEFASLSRIDKLIKMQHYGLPTRLLDFSYNSLVALFFACSGEPDKDGAVLEVHGFTLYFEDFPWISIIMKFIDEYDSLGLNMIQMIDELKNDKSISTKGVEPFYNEDAIMKILTSPIGLYPRFTNERIKHQNGLFIIPGMKISKKIGDTLFFDKIAYNNIQDLFPESRTIIIPSARKEEFLHDLSRIGIHRGSLFPELDIQAKYITDIYSVD